MSYQIIWLNVTNEVCIFNRRINLECLANDKEEHENKNNNDDHNDVECNSTGRSNNAGRHKNKSSMLLIDTDRWY